MRGYITLFVFDTSNLESDAHAQTLGAVVRAVSESSGTTHICFGDLSEAAGSPFKVPEYLGFVAEDGTITPVSTDDRLSEVWTLSELSAHGVGIWSGDKDIHASVHAAAATAGLGYMGAIRTSILDYPIVFFGWAEHFKLERVMDITDGEVVEGSDRSGLQWQQAAALTAEEPKKEAASTQDEPFSITTDPDEALTILESRKRDREVLSLNDRAAAMMDTGDYDSSRQLLHQALKLNPRFPMAHVNLGASYMEQERWAEAIPWFENALSVDPQVEGAGDALEHCRARAGVPAPVGAEDGASQLSTPSAPVGLESRGGIGIIPAVITAVLLLALLVWWLL